MCGIFGFFNSDKALNKVVFSMDKISYRGKDACGVYFENNVKIFEDVSELKSGVSVNEDNGNVDNDGVRNVLGHVLHSIVDFVPQPIISSGEVLVANCEIYNWKDLNEKNGFSCKNDSQVILELLKSSVGGVDVGVNGKGILNVLDMLDGSFAFGYLNEKTGKLVLVRDILGIKPLWYFHDSKSGEFGFSSERKALLDRCAELSDDSVEVVELNPREVLVYDVESKNISFIEREFVYDVREVGWTFEMIEEKTKKLLFSAIEKRVPKGEKVGVLFSGGVDSTFIAYVLKELGIDFTCYTAKVEGGNILEAQDLIYGREIAQKYGFEFKVATISTDKLEKEVKDVIELIEDREYLKISVAMPFYLACKKAKEDGVKVIFSGLGSEEIFAGYLRHRKVEDINLECYNGLMCLHERDLYRDDVITMRNNMELRLPFLDKELVDFCLLIPAKYKLSEDKKRNKMILRDIAQKIGLDEKYAQRPKQAAQYGSKFDKGLHRLAKDAGKGKQEWARSLK